MFIYIVHHSSFDCGILFIILKTVLEYLFENYHSEMEITQQVQLIQSDTFQYLNMYKISFIVLCELSYTWYYWRVKHLAICLNMLVVPFNLAM